MSLLKSTVAVGATTMISRVLGLVRDILLARYLGAGLASDAFFVAFKLPNFFRRLFAEGAFSAAFVPLFAAAPAQKSFAERVLAVLVVVLIGFTALVEVLMPWVVLAITGGFPGAEPEKLALAVELSRITFPYLALVSLVSLFAGVLNGIGRFAAAAAAPTLLNLAFIIALWLFHDGGPATARAISIGVTAAGAAQLIWLYWAAGRAGFKLRLVRPRLSADVKEMLKLAWPAALGAGAMQVNLLIDTILATRYLPEGSISYLYYGDRLSQLPIGVIGVAVGTVLLPTLSRQIARGSHDAAIHGQNRAIELALFLTIPATAALMMLADILIHVLFERGAFDAAAGAASAQALVAYAAGLPAYILVKTLTPGFYARKDTKTPVRIAMIAVAANSVLGVLLMFPLRHVGLAAATAIAAWLNAGLLYATLAKRGHFAIDRQLRRRLPRMAAASLAMLALLYGGALIGLGGIGGLVALVVLGCAGYLGCAWWFGAVKLDEVKAQLTRKT